MWNDSIEAISLLSLIGVPAVIASCIVGSIVAAIRGVSRRGCIESAKRSRIPLRVYGSPSDEHNRNRRGFIGAEI